MELFDGVHKMPAVTRITTALLAAAALCVTAAPATKLEALAASKVASTQAEVQQASAPTGFVWLCGSGWHLSGACGHPDSV